MARAVLFGTPVSPGIAIGRVRFMHKARQDDERRITAAEVAAEQETLRAAAEGVRASLAATMENVPEDLSEYRDVIAAQMEMVAQSAERDTETARRSADEAVQVGVLANKLKALAAQFHA